VTLPVPGPISRTVSVGLMAALATMAVTTAGFLRKCCPRLVLGAIKLAEAAGGLEFAALFLVAAARAARE